MEGGEGRGGERRGEKGLNFPNHVNQVSNILAAEIKTLFACKKKKTCCQKTCPVNDRRYRIEFIATLLLCLEHLLKARNMDDSFDLGMNGLRNVL